MLGNLHSLCSFLLYQESTGFFWYENCTRAGRRARRKFCLASEGSRVEGTSNVCLYSIREVVGKAACARCFRSPGPAEAGHSANVPRTRQDASKVMNLT